MLQIIIALHFIEFIEYNPKQIQTTLSNQVPTIDTHASYPHKHPTKYQYEKRDDEIDDIFTDL
jgi:hypothetical protein